MHKKKKNLHCCIVKPLIFLHICGTDRGEHKNFCPYWAIV